MKYPNKIVENATIAPEYQEMANVMAKNTIDEFLELCKIPHPSGHCDKLRDYLYDWGQNHNIETTIDRSGCVIMEIPATEGGKDIDKVIFQAHFDMVAVADKANTSFVPEKTPIVPIYDEEEGVIHTGWNTSLGADDGAGVATCLAIARIDEDPRTQIEHGPIKIILTYDEETSMLGCKLLSKEAIDAKYLVNLDSITVGMIITSCAGGFFSTIRKKLDRIAPGKNSNVIAFEIWGLAGGHSGAEIDKNRGNSLKIFTDVLERLLDESVNFNIRRIKSGVLMNAIPAKLNAELVVGHNDAEDARRIIEEVLIETRSQYSDGKNMEFDIEIREASNKPVLSISDSTKIFKLLTMFPIGLISTFPSGEPKTSNNMGVLEINNDELYAEVLYRSNDDSTVNDALRTMLQTCFDYDYDFTVESLFPTWNKQESNVLSDLMCEAFEKVCNLEAKILDIHAGLETGYFAKQNPDLVMISLGPDIVNEHSRKETLFTKTLPHYSATILYLLSHL